MASDLVHTRALLEKLRCPVAAERLGDFLEAAVRERLSPHELLNRVLESEVEAREEKRIGVNLKFSGLPVGKTLESFDFSFYPSADKGRIESLATCEFIERKENLIIFGPPGVGKTHLAAGLGVKAIKNGFSVAFVTLDRLIGRHRRSHLVIVDEVGYRSLLVNRGQFVLLLHLLSVMRPPHSSLPVNKCVRDDEILAAAVLDRLLHHASSINISGRSYRLKEREVMFKE